MKDILTTSVNLPVKTAAIWREHRHEIMQFGGRYLRIQMRNELRRGVTRAYNRGKGQYARVTTRFTPAEYDTLHFVAASLRVSVSSLIYGLILLWLKPARRAIRRFFATNCAADTEGWNPEGGFAYEYLTFWRLEGDTRPNPPPWQVAGLTPAS